jgi:hypothetical protein
MQGSDRHGFVITFPGTGPDSLVHYQNQADRACWTAAETPRGSAWCYGELLSYGVEGDTATCLKRVLADWETHTIRYDRLNGRFVLIFWDKRAEAWSLVTDRVGAMHSYMVRQGERCLAIGSDLFTLAQQASTRQLDWQAITSFLALGFFLDNRTYFGDVQILWPRSIYRIGAQGDVQEHRYYWQWHHTVDTRRSYTETVAAYDTLLRQAVKRCVVHGRIMLPISGGLDSRSLAAVLPGDANVQAYSYGYAADSIETSIAAQVARARHLPFTVHIIRPYLFDRLAEIVQALHGSQDVTQARQTSVNAWVGERADAVMTGLWGDVWCDQMGLADGLPEGTTTAAHALKKFQKRGRAWLLENVNAPRIDSASAAERLAESIAAGIGAFDSIADPDFQVKAYKTSRWAFRWSNASLRGFEIGAPPRIPYYDVDLIDFFCTVPTAFVRDRRLQIDHLKRYAPDLARIRWQSADANLYLARYGYWIGLPRRAFNKARRILTGARAIQRNWEVQLSPASGQEGLQAWLVQPGRKVHEFVSPEAVSNLLDEFFKRPGAANGYTVSILLTFSAWLEIAASSATVLLGG